MAGPWEKYQSAAPETGPWSKYGAPPPVVNDIHDDGTPAPPTFLNTLGREVKAMNPVPMAEGMYKAFTEPPTKEESDELKAHGHSDDFFTLGVKRLMADPATYATKWYVDAVRGKIPNAYEQALSVAPEAIGQSAGGALAAKAMGEVPGAVKAVPDVVKAATPVVRAGASAVADTASGLLDNDLVGMASPRLVHLGKLAGKAADLLRPPEISLNPNDYFPSRPVDALSQSASGPRMDAMSEQVAQPAPQQAPAAAMPDRGAYDARPTSRAEITDDKAVEDAMRYDLDKHGWRALSEERQKFFSDNGPQQTKGQLIANTKARVIMENAMNQAQQILDEQKISAETPVRYTKTVTPKAKTPVATSPQAQTPSQNIDISGDDLTDLLQRSLDAVKRKTGK